MGHQLDGILLRLQRADQRLALLERQRSILLRRKGDRVIGKFDAQSGDYVYRVPGRPPALSLGLVVGDFAYYLRSVLDNILFGLVIARFGTPTHPSEIQFPIYEKKAKALANARAGQTRIEANTSGILDEDFTFIEGLQPYKLGPYLARWHPLAMLGFLNDMDKHRYIHVAYAAAAMTPMGGPQAGRWFFQTRYADALGRMGMLEDPASRPDLWERTGEAEHTLRFIIGGFIKPSIIADGDFVSVHKSSLLLSLEGSNNDPAEVLRLFGVRPRPNAKVKVQPSLLLDISFSERERPVSIFDLRDIRATVQQVVDRFAEII